MPAYCTFIKVHQNFTYIYPEVEIWKLFVFFLAIAIFLISLFKFSKKVLITLAILGLTLYTINYNLGFMIVDSDAWVYPYYIDVVIDSMPYSLFTEYGQTDPHYTPHIILLGILSKIGIESKVLVLLLPYIVIPLFIFGIYIFVKELFDEKTGIICAIISLFFWGYSSSGFHPYAITEVWLFYYNSVISLIPLLFALYVILNIEKGKLYYILAVIISFLCIITYIITGIFLVLFIIAFIVTKKVNFKKMVMLGGAVAILIVIWPGYSVIGSIVTYSGYNLHLGNIITWDKRVRLVKETAGIALIGILGNIYLIKKKKYEIPIILSIAGCFIISPLIYNLRFTILFMIALHIGWSVLIRDMKRKEIMILIPLILLGVTMGLQPRLGMTGFTYAEGKIPIELSFLEGYANENTVIISDRNTEYMIMTQMKIKTTSTHRGIGISDEFFAVDTTNERRSQIINEYKVIYILVNKRIYGKEIIGILNENFKKEYENEECILWSVTT